MDVLNQMQQDMALSMDTQLPMWVYFGLGVLSMVVLLWSAKPGRSNVGAAVGLLAVVALGLGLSFADSSSVLSRWMQYASVIGAPLVIWWFGRECWTGYLSPWLFSWRRIGVQGLALIGVGYLMTKAVPSEQKDVFWVLYSFALLLSPIFVFKALMWWVLHALKAAYVGKYLNSRESKRTIDVYFTTWWNDVVRRKRVDPDQWLSITSQHPQFMASRWWQKKGTAFWPDVLEWNAKLGTSNMLWFIQERMDNPPEVLDDYSGLKDIWSFSAEVRALGP